MSRVESSTLRKQRLLWAAEASEWIGKEESVVDKSFMFDRNDLEYDEERNYVGFGQFSTTYRATLVGSSKPVAVKVFFESKHAASLLRYEAKIYCLIGKHENITEFIGLCDHPRFSALLLEYVDGGHLGRFIRSSVSQNVQWWDQCLNIAMQITCGMVHLHNLSPQPVTSIELNPESVLIRRRGRRVFCKLTGFCFARVGGGENILTGNMLPSGILPYIAPERHLVFSGNAELRKKHDVWSFGIILWEIRERTKPFNRELFATPPPPPRKDSPEGFNHIQMNCCVMNPVQRPSFLGTFGSVSYADRRLGISITDLRERLNSLLEARTAEQLGLDDDNAKQIYMNALKEGYAEAKFIRINIVGKDGAGKTSLWKSLTEQTFDSEELSTVGATSDDKNLHIVVKESCNWTTSIDAEESLKAFDRMLASSVATRMKQERERNTSESAMQRSSFPGPSVNKFSEEPQVASLSTPIPTTHTVRETRHAPTSFSDLPATEATKQYLDTLPDDVKRLIGQFMNDDKAHSEVMKEKYIDAMDFGGQDVFYATHYLYLNKDAIYYVVFDASEELPGFSASHFRSEDGRTEIKLPGQMSNYDRFEEWLSAVHVLDLPNRAEIKTAGVCPIVFPIGTHKDIAENKTVQDEVTAVERPLLEWQKEYMFKQIELKEDLLEHLADPDRVFYVDNTHAAKNGQRKDDIQDIRCLTEQIAQEMEREIRVPFRWLRFEKKLRQRKIELARKSDCEPIASLSSLKIEAKDCGIDAEEEFLVALQYLSKRAVILYHPIPNSPAADNVILDLSWLTNVLQRVVTVTPRKGIPRNLWKDSRRAEREGIVTDGLLKFYLKDVKKRDVIIDLMKYFNLLCDRHDVGCPADERDYINIESPLEDPPLSSSDENVASYFVPCLLREEREPESLGVTDESAPRPLQLHSNVRIPLPLFYRILTVFARRFSRRPTLHRNLAYFNVHSGHRLEIVYLSDSLQFTVLKSSPEPIKRDVCCAIRQYVVDRINKARDPGMRGLRLELRCDGVTIPERYRCPGGTEDLYDVHGKWCKPPSGLDLWYAEKRHEAASATASAVSPTCSQKEPCSNVSYNYYAERIEIRNVEHNETYSDVGSVVSGVELTNKGPGRFDASVGSTKDPSSI
ncbi:uncharacterized protein [Oscarella lobularis]|uniref:uncharacterized protein isoform X2 n=1 Tax=Oscarella lobularis TaxID=121494 RepID=UPI0033137A08